MAAINYSPVFAAPTEYERLAAEARRRQAMAEALEAQAYQPLSGSAAPTPSAAPLVMALQGYLGARQRRKAEEAGEKAKTADIEGMRELMRQLGPQERSGAENAIEQMRQTAMPGQLSAEGTYTPSQITPSTAPIGMPYTQAAPVGQERQNLLMQAQFGGTPRAAELAKALMSVKPEETDLKETAQGFVRVGKQTGTVTPVTYKGEAVLPRDAYSMGMTPQQRQQFELDVAKYGIDVAQLNLARNKAADEGIDISGTAAPSISRGAPSRTPQAQMQTPAMTPAQMRTAGEVPRAPQRVAQPRASITPPVVPTEAPVAEQQRIPQIKNPLVPPKVKRELLILQPETEKSVRTSLTGADRLINMADDLASHRGIENITGPIAQYSITDIAKDESAANARALYDSLVSQVGLLKIQAAKDESKTGASGYGAMTREEWPRLEQSVAAIGLAQNAKSLDIALRNFKNEVQAIFEGSKDFYESKYGPLNWKPVKYEKQSALFPRAKPTISENRKRARELVGIPND